MAEVGGAADETGWRRYLAWLVAGLVAFRLIGLFVDDGDWLVGSDMPTGRYRSSPSGDTDSCEWELATGFTGHDDEVVAHGAVHEAFEVELRAGHRFTSTGCGRWTLVP